MDGAGRKSGDGVNIGLAELRDCLLACRGGGSTSGAAAAAAAAVAASSSRSESWWLVGVESLVVVAPCCRPRFIPLVVVVLGLEGVRRGDEANALEAGVSGASRLGGVLDRC